MALAPPTCHAYARLLPALTKQHCRLRPDPHCSAWERRRDLLVALGCIRAGFEVLLVATASRTGTAPRSPAARHWHRLTSKPCLACSAGACLLIFVSEGCRYGQQGDGPLCPARLLPRAHSPILKKPGMRCEVGTWFCLRQCGTAAVACRLEGQGSKRNGQLPPPACCPAALVLRASAAQARCRVRQLLKLGVWLGMLMAAQRGRL